MPTSIPLISPSTLSFSHTHTKYIKIYVMHVI